MHIFLKRKPVSKQPALTIKQIVRKCRLKPVTLSISQDVFQSAISQPANIGPQDVPLQRPLKILLAVPGTIQSNVLGTS